MCGVKRHGSALARTQGAYLRDLSVSDHRGACGHRGAVDTGAHPHGGATESRHTVQELLAQIFAQMTFAHSLRLAPKAYFRTAGAQQVTAGSQAGSKRKKTVGSHTR